MDNEFRLDIGQRFPWTGRFETKAEIDTYLAGNRVQCLLCGKWFKVLAQHLVRTHGITSDDYRKRYGLPWRRELCGVGTTEKLSKNMFDRLKEGFRAPIETTKTGLPIAKRSPDQPFPIKANAEALKPIIEKIRKFTDRDFKNVLLKMLNEKKGLNEACREAGMPHFRAVSKYAKKNAEFRAALEATYAQLPYSVQAGANRLPEKQFRNDILFLKRSGITVADISRLLGVSRSLINDRFKQALNETISGGDA